jgi:DMSO/TMAO reductase YedYZ molybdopterin-dependent catalytic subunit
MTTHDSTTDGDDQPSSDHLEIDPMAPRADARSAPPWTGPLAGLLAAALAVGIGWFVAAIGDVVSPLDAVGSEFIDHTPHWLKVLAVRWFGTDDKLALRVGMVVTIALLSLVVGVIARRRALVGVAAIDAFGVVGAIVAAGRPAQGAGAAIPPIVGAIAGGALLWVLAARISVNDPARRRPGPSRAPRGFDRRRFLITSAGAAGVAAVTAAVGRSIEAGREDDLRREAQRALPSLGGGTASTTPGSAGTGPAATGPIASAEPVPPAGAQLFDATPFITPNSDFYLIDTALSLPRIDLTTWKVSIKGMVSRPLTLSYDDLLARPMIERTITIACVSNEVGGGYIGNAVWQGIRLSDLLAEAGVDPKAEQVFGTSVDGFTCGFPVSAATDGRDAMIAVGMNGRTLPPEHGFPARVIVPGLYGYVSATKWLSSLELTTWDAAQGYWVPRGWSRDAPIKTQSRVDLPKRKDRLVAGPVQVAGVAWAQHRGVAKVEVRVDDGPWAEATLAADVTDDTWRQWVWEWPATTGRHSVQVRATDKTGAVQTEAVSRPDPDGATGYHTRTFDVA